MNYVMYNEATCAKAKYITPRLSYENRPKGRKIALHYPHYSIPELGRPESRKNVPS